MSKKTKIKKDNIGLYTICGGYISRPFFSTQFNEGDDVLTHHFGGSTRAGVTSPDKPTTHNFKRSGIYEYWGTTGLSSSEYKKKVIKPGYEGLFGKSYKTFDEYLELLTNWYSKNHITYILKEHNLKFTK